MEAQKIATPELSINFNQGINYQQTLMIKRVQFFFPIQESQYSAIPTKIIPQTNYNDQVAALGTGNSRYHEGSIQSPSATLRTSQKIGIDNITAVWYGEV